MEAAPAQAAIVIFGAAVWAGGKPSPTLRTRVAAAASFGARLQPPPLFIPTGGLGQHSPTEAAVMAGLLREAGVPEARILQEGEGLDTLHSARAVAALLRARAWHGPVYVATSRYHLPRCRLLLWMLGFRNGRVPPPPGSGEFRHIRWWLREIPALPYDALLLLSGRG